jgi:hypothetical protein
MPRPWGVAQPLTCTYSGPSGVSPYFLRLVEYRVELTLIEGRIGGQQILILSQAPNRKPNDVNHTEPEFFLQAVNEMQVRVGEPNGR